MKRYDLTTAGLPDADLVIRTSGERRLTGFLLWQSADATIHFDDRLWPDSTPPHSSRPLLGTPPDAHVRPLSCFHCPAIAPSFSRHRH
ncbi:undecaprenyl diphosphate synthase family protein [Streptomyces sp. NPDC056637]